MSVRHRRDGSGACGRRWHPLRSSDGPAGGRRGRAVGRATGSRCRGEDADEPARRPHPRLQRGVSAVPRGAGGDDSGGRRHRRARRLLCAAVALRGTSGTHMDAPAHFIADGRQSPEITPEELIVPIVVVDISARVPDDADALVMRPTSSRSSGGTGASQRARSSPCFPAGSRGRAVSTPTRMSARTVSSTSPGSRRRPWSGCSEPGGFGDGGEHD